MKHWLNLKYLLRHKWYVFMAGLFFDVPWWQLFVHDWSKLLPSEWFPYARHFFDVRKQGQRDLDIKEESPEFQRAWLYHQRRNAHHWEYWLLDSVTAIEMPDQYAREMVADWVGAGRAQGYNDPWNWYARNKERIVLHPRTREQVEVMIQRYRERAECA